MGWLHYLGHFDALGCVDDNIILDHQIEQAVWVKVIDFGDWLEL
jgi:hypothetical protein